MIPQRCVQRGMGGGGARGKGLGEGDGMAGVMLAAQVVWSALDFLWPAAVSLLIDGLRLHNTHTHTRTQ